MTRDDIAADREVDALYAGLRGRFGTSNSRANGYVFESYFRREREILFSLMNKDAGVVVDIACGSGLMVQPLIGRHRLVFGIDFNAAACRGALGNGLPVARADAFNLPLANDCVDEIVTCQFFNQQSADAVRRFVVESARVLRPGGRVIMVWRNGDALIHRLALGVFGFFDRLRGRPIFPYENHAFSEIRDYGTAAGLTVEEQSVSFPPLSWRSTNVTTFAARAIGASNICLLQKPN